MSVAKKLEKCFSSTRIGFRAVSVAKKVNGRVLSAMMVFRAVSAANKWESETVPKDVSSAP